MNYGWNIRANRLGRRICYLAVLGNRDTGSTHCAGMTGKVGEGLHVYTLNDVEKTERCAVSFWSC